jgi:hypothetical protein
MIFDPLGGWTETGNLEITLALSHRLSVMWQSLRDGA